MKVYASALAGLAGALCLGAGYTFAAHAQSAALPLLAGQAASPSVVAGPAAQFSKTANVRLLDKQTNRVDHLTLEVGKPQKIAALSLTLQKCAWGVGGVPLQDAAWLDVAASAGEPEFHGWMFNTMPGISTYDHPRYDVQLESCARPAGYVPPAPARVAPAQPVGYDHGAPADDEAPVNDDFVVPGINSDEPAAEPGQPGGAVPFVPAAAQPVYEVPAEQPYQQPVEPLPLPPAEQVPAAEGDRGELQRMMDMPAGQ